MVITQKDIAKGLADAMLYTARGWFNYVRQPTLVESAVDGQTVYSDAFEVETKNGKRFLITVEELH